jgi:hypothetical protein
MKIFFLTPLFLLLLLLRLSAQNCSNICLDFDPASNPNPDYVESGAVPIAANANFTMEARFLLPVANTGTGQRFLMGLGGSANRVELLEMGGLLRIIRQSSSVASSLSSISTVNFRDGAWHHIAVTRNGSSLSVYVDGTLRWANTAFTGTMTATTFRVGAPALSGATIAGVSWDGLIDEVRVWNTVRTAAEIGATLGCGLQGNEAGLRLYYPFNQGTGGGTNTGINVATDQTANANNGQLSDRFALTGTNSNWVCGDPNFQSCSGACPANFTFVVNPCGQVAFTNTSTAQGTLSWNFGHTAGGAANTSTLPNPVYQYPATGNYNVCLTLTTATGAPCTTCKTVTVAAIDNVPPVLSCQNAVLVIGTPPTPQLLTVQQVLGAPVIDECCSNVSVSIVSGQTQYSCADACQTPRTVVVQATDCAGNTATCSASVTVRDNTPPVAICTSNINVTLNTAGTATISPNDINNGSVDNCQIGGIDLSTGSFGCPPPGEPCPYRRTVTMTVTDLCGNSSSCTAQVTIQETVPPVARCKNATIFLNAAGTATLSWTDIDNGSSDACHLGNLSVGPINYSCPAATQPCPYTTTVVLTARDCSNNTASCTATLTIADNLPPVFNNCPSNVIVSTAPGQTSASVTWVAPAATDNCSGVVVTSTHQPGATFPCGNTTVTYTATDRCGNTAVCSFIVTVNCGTSACQCGFTNVTFNAPPATQTVICNQSGFDVGCPEGKTYTVSGTFNCGPLTANCTASALTWTLTRGGTNIATGTFTAGSFNILLNGALMTTAGTYTMTLTGNCGTTTCSCTFTLVSFGCGNGCECGRFSNISLNDVSNAAAPVGLFPMTCGGAYNVPCPVAGKQYQISYSFACNSTSTPPCVPTNMAYSIVNTGTGSTVVPLTPIAAGAPIPVDGSAIAAAGVYEILIQGNCGTNLCQCRVKLRVECPPPGCQCGFSEMVWKDPTTPPAQPLICGQSTVFLKCPAGKTFDISGIFNCSPASCAAGGLTWNISSSTSISVASGTYTTTTGGAFSISIPGAPIATPGNYTLTVSGTCGGARCTCQIRIVVSGCNPCECGQFTGLSISKKTKAGEPPVSVALTCGRTDSMPCPVEGINWALSGSFACVGDCQPTNMTWEVKNNSGTVVANGTMAASPFTVYINGTAISTAGIYTLTLGATCGTQRCSCVVRLVVRDCTPPVTTDTLCGMAVVTCFSGSDGGNGVVVALKDITDKNDLSVDVGTYVSNSITGSKMWTRGSAGDNLGEVFGIATDKDNNIYVTATTAYSPNNPPGFNGSGGVYKIKRNSLSVDNTWNVSLPNFAGPCSSLSQSGCGSIIPYNNAPGLGNICYDPQNNVLYVSNFEDGAIYKVLPSTGAYSKVYDPVLVAPDNGLAGFAPLGERIWGIGITTNSSGELEFYYSVWATDKRNGSLTSSTIHNTIRRVKIDNAGNFIGFSDSEVIKLSFLSDSYTGSSPACRINTPQFSNPVSDIEFSSDGNTMLLAERTMYGDVISAPNTTNYWWAHTARVFEYKRSGLTWVLSKQIEIGGKPSLTPPTLEANNSAGGIDFGYGFDRKNDTPIDCDSMIWATGDYLHQSSSGVLIYGMQGFAANSTSISNANSYLVDFDQNTSVYDKSQIGDVDIFKCLSCPPTPPCDSIFATLTPVSLPNDPEKCCYRINIQNAYANTFASIKISIAGADLIPPSDIMLLPGWSVSSFGSNMIEIQHSSGYLPTGSFSPGIICPSNISAPEQTITLDYLDGQDNELCDDEFKLKCPFCMTITDEELDCNSATGQVNVSFCIQNENSWTASSLIITPPTGTTISPSGFSISVPPGGSYCASFVLTIPPGINLTNGCFTYTLHEGNVVQGAPPKRCCMIDRCYEIPDCCPNFATIMPVDTSGGDCCWKITVNQPPGTAQFVTVNLIPNTTGVGISGILPPTGGWNVNTGGLPLSTTFSLNPSANLPATANLPTICFDVPDGSVMPQKLEIVWSTREAVLCWDTIEFNCKPDTDCADVDSVRLVCNIGGTGQTYTIKVTYTPDDPLALPATHIAVVDVMPPLMTGTGIFPLSTPLNPGGMTTISIPFNGPPGTEVCFNLNLYNRQENPLKVTECCVTETKHCFTLRNCIQSLRLVSMFPNPTQGNITLQFDEEGSVPACSVRLRDVTGRLVQELDIPGGTLRQEVQLPESAQGLYFIELLQEQKRVWTGKVVKQ